tara:strand:+ start:505 stop:729 length:225 start_codon:yes stop_codon:yes gene_type:complete
MKGATADPFDRTTSPPKMTIMTKIGISQNFLRASKNDKISDKKDMFSHSKLVFERPRLGARRFSMDPVALRFSI